MNPKRSLGTVIRSSAPNIPRNALKMASKTD